MKAILHLLASVLGNLRDMLPILLTLAAFEGLVLGRIPPDPVAIVLGMLAVLLGLPPQLLSPF